MKKIIFIAIVLISSFSYSQGKETKKWHSTMDIEFIIPNKVEYYYGFFDTNYNAIVGGQDNIENANASFGILYSINYNVFKKLSLGAITGYQYQDRPDFAMLKLGGSIKYFFVDNNNVYVYLDIANNFSLNKDQFKNGSNVRIGIGFPVMKREKFNLNINVFYETNDLTLEDAKPLFDTEIPDNIIFRSHGISLGIKF